MVKELTSAEFDERFSPIFEHISHETGIAFDPTYFFAQWRRLMEIKVARTWSNDGCVLGAVFAPDMFNGNMRGLVYFWFSLPEARGTGRPRALLTAFENAAREDGCETVSSAAHVLSSPRHLENFYERQGYRVSELCFSKSL